MSQTIRVLVVDDSALMRHRLSVILGSAPGFEVVGTASDGNECLARLQALRPDVITMDVEMPALGGLETLRRIMREQATPVIMVSSLTESGAQATLDALSLGAVEYLAKPATPGREAQAAFAQELLHKVGIAARVRMPRIARQVSSPAPAGAAPTAPSPASAIFRPSLSRPASTIGSRRPADRPLVLIGSSTGGPQALDHLMTNLEHDLPASFLIVQHMPPLFTQSLAARLARRSGIEAREIQEDDEPRPNLILLAPGGYHATLGGDHRLHLDQTDPVHGVRPAIDRTLKSLAEHWTGPCLVVILTGMGVDGTEGARAMHQRGARIYAQDESTSIVYGMPRSVAEAGLAGAVLPLEKMSGAIAQWAKTATPAMAGRL
ncbi:MAG TPA: chemotaxis response regulator protein-glutamate methylesterase [Chloroflexota bacterium]|nr:chemotaxis response regulator protein-glutamate methylesterase [Chloroflexota bacterium]